MDNNSFQTKFEWRSVIATIDDPLIGLELNGFKYNHFLEYDTGGIDKERLARKFRRCFEYLVYGDWQKDFGQYPTILFITYRSEGQRVNLFEEYEIFGSEIKYRIDMPNKNEIVQIIQSGTKLDRTGYTYLLLVLI